MTFKTKMKQWLFALCTALTVAAAPSAAQAQTYVRPSKGTPVAVFPGGSTPVLSGVYDMSAFVEAQLDVTLTQTTDATVSYNVPNLARYVRFKVGYVQGANDKNVLITTEGADNPAGPFITLNSPTALQEIRPNPSGTLITAVKMVMTPLPYQTTQYTRPQKGIPSTIINGSLPAIGQFLPVVTIPMTGFAAISVKIVVGNLPGGCARDASVSVLDGTTLGEAAVAGVTVNETDGSFAVNVNARFITVYGSVHAGSGAADCQYTITATPLPYTVSTDKFVNSANQNIWGVSAVTPSAVGANDYTYHNMILTNIGDYPVKCHTSSSDAVVIANQSGIVLGGPTAAGRADGGRIELKNFSYRVYCLSIGGASSVATFQY